MDIKSLPEDVRANIRSGLNIISIPHCINELVLNSLDAKSSSIAIRINLKTFQLQVVDNGEGITKTNMELIGMQYMTNKCHTLEDYKSKLKYYGFRGETLYSIKINSKSLNIVTRSANDSQTYNKTFNENGENEVTVTTHRPSEGTTITIKDFLFNTPVRQNRVNNLTFDEIRKNLECLFIMHPNVTFSLRNDINRKMIYKNSQADSVETALVSIFPQINKEMLTQMKIKKDYLSITGLIYIKQLSNNKCQFIFVNKRPIVNPEFYKEIEFILKDSTLCQDNKKETNFAFILNIRCPNSHMEVTTCSVKYIIQFKNEDLVRTCIQKLFTKFLQKENLTAETKTFERKKPIKRKRRSQIHLSDINFACKSKILKTNIGEEGLSAIVNNDFKTSRKKCGFDLQIFDFPKENKVKIKRTEKRSDHVLNKQVPFNKGTFFEEFSNRDKVIDNIQDSNVNPILSISDKCESFQGSGEIVQNSSLMSKHSNHLKSINSIDNEKLGKALLLEKFFDSTYQSFSIEEPDSPDSIDIQTAVSVSVKIQQKTIKRKKKTNNFNNIIANVENDRKKMFIGFDDAHTMVSKCIQTTQIDKALYSQMFEDGCECLISKNKCQTDTKCVQIDYNFNGKENGNVSKYFNKYISETKSAGTIVPGSIHIGCMDFFKQRWVYEKRQRDVYTNSACNQNQTLGDDNWNFANNQLSYNSHNVYTKLSNITLLDSIDQLNVKTNKDITMPNCNDHFSFRKIKNLTFANNLQKSIHYDNSVTANKSKELYPLKKLDIVDITLDSVLKDPEKYSSKPFNEINMFLRPKEKEPIFDQRCQLHNIKIPEASKFKSCLKENVDCAIPHENKFNINSFDAHNLKFHSTVRYQVDNRFCPNFNEEYDTMFSENHNYVENRNLNISQSCINVLSDVVIRDPRKNKFSKLENKNNCDEFLFRPKILINKNGNRKDNSLNVFKNNVFVHSAHSKQFPQEQIEVGIIDQDKKFIDTKNKKSNLLFNKKYNSIISNEHIIHPIINKTEYFKDNSDLTSIMATKFESQLCTENQIKNTNHSKDKVKKWLGEQHLLQNYEPIAENSAFLDIQSTNNVNLENIKNAKAYLVKNNNRIGILNQKNNQNSKQDQLGMQMLHEPKLTNSNLISKFGIKKYHSTPLFSKANCDLRKTKSEYFDKTHFYTPNCIISERFQEAQLLKNQIDQTNVNNISTELFNENLKIEAFRNDDIFIKCSNENINESDIKSVNTILSSDIIPETEYSIKKSLDQNMSSEQIVPPSDEQNLKFNFFQESFNTIKNVTSDFNQFTCHNNSFINIDNGKSIFETSFKEFDLFLSKPKNKKINKLCLIKNREDENVETMSNAPIEEKLNTIGMHVDTRLNRNLNTIEKNVSDLVISLSPDKVLPLNREIGPPTIQEIGDDWAKLSNCYINLRTGMTTFSTPKDTNNYNLEKRKDFMPKGFSQMVNREIIEIPLSAITKTRLYNKIAESYQDELSTIKWNHFITNDPKEFFESLYKDQLKPSDDGIADITKHNFSRLAVKSFNNQNSVSFTKEVFNDIVVIGQLDKKFIVTLTRKKTMILLFDQHAVHERIRVEMLFEDYVLKDNESIIFKMSYLENEIPLEMKGDDIDLMRRYPNCFNKVGILYRCDVAYIHIITLPTCLYNKFKRNNDLNKFKKLLKNVIEEILEMVVVTRGIICNIPLFIHNVINSEACRGSKMFGDELSHAECVKYIADLSKCNLPFQCAHGRPTMAPILELLNLDLKVNRVSLENIFKK